MSLEEWKNEFSGKKILIYGYGMEGRSTYRWIRHLCQDQEITIADGGKGLEIALKETVNTTCISDQNLDLSQYDLVMKSPGIVLPQGTDLKNITGEAQLFLKHYRHRTIGITGTKGKSTTASLTAAILAKKYDVELVGNIGRSCFDVIEQMEKGALAVFEISCHQLEYCPYSPHVAVFLNLYEEHLDHYGSFEKYGEAKSHILTNQTKDDILLIHKDLKKYIPLAKAKTLLIGKDVYNEGRILHIPGKTLTIENCKLIGDHNYGNLAVAWYIADSYGVNKDDAKAAAASFMPLHHRLEDLGEFHHIRFVNDSISTIGQAAIKALEALDDVDTILIGGMDRGIEYNELEDYLFHQDHLNVIFMYASGQRIYQEMKEKNMIKDSFYQVNDLAEAVALAKKITAPHHIVLLSPAASSYDHFKNFEERGDCFRSLAAQ